MRWLPVRVRRTAFGGSTDTVAAGFLTSGMATDLRDALESIANLSEYAETQAAAIEAGRQLNNRTFNPETCPRSIGAVSQRRVQGVE